jgi:hypothetical protein
VSSNSFRVWDFPIDPSSTLDFLKWKEDSKDMSKLSALRPDKKL